MTEHEANEIFAQIVSTDDNADLAEVKAPEIDPRKDGVYYHATSEYLAGNVVFYQVVVDHRVVAMVRVAEDVEVEKPDFLNYTTLHEGTKFHAITLTKPDGTGLTATKGVTIKAPEGILNRTLIKAYVMPRLARLLVRLYGLGA